ncbi:AsmA family protein [Chitinophaga jiangningensis]|uniref:AsmA family protein n=1 Tax=Chitinophaga jiangningensis TaxID=1419482 RepID=A0A1M7B2Q9_9BACT|nr:AsmA-like C-terminal region-containing protein [Chitinophaga jiangningensis]SHL49253.1 AsmA family protein [Chitinophaga jiangningensis]
MRKWLRLTLIILGGFLVLIFLLFLGLALYIKANKAAFLDQVTAQINDKIDGKVLIADMEPSLIRNFPNISLGLKQVQLQDSLYPVHKRPLLDVQEVYIRLNTWSILRKRVDVKEIIVENGTICLYTDSSGYTNTSMLQRKSPSPKKKSKDADIGHLLLQNITFIIENKQKLKHFELEVKSLSGRTRNQGDSLRIALNINMISKHFEFNTDKGSYLKDKPMEMPLHLTFNKKSKVLLVPEQEIKIDNQPVLIGGQFVFAEKPPAFSLKITANQVLLKEAASWLPPNISTKLNDIGLEKPLDAVANLDGHMKFRDTPRVVVKWKTVNNALHTSLGQWTNCSFTGDFNNQVLPITDHTDANSAVNIFNLTASFGEVPVKADTIRVVNLKQPLLRGHFQSSFQLAKLNGAEELPLAFSAGSAVADLNYTGPLMKNDPTPSALLGVVQVTNAAFSYQPRALNFKNCNATLRFTGQDLLLENIKLQSGNSSLFMNGQMKNVLNFYFTAPEKIVLDWNIKSPLVDLNEFKSYLSPRVSKKKQAAHRKAKLSRVGAQLDEVLAASNVNMNVQLDKTTYKHFTAQNVKAVLALTESDILLNNIGLQLASGSLNMKGKVHQQGNNNYFDVAAGFVNVNMSQLFYAFDNFGMEGLTYKNIKGVATVRTNMKGNILDNGSLAKRSLNGSIQLAMKKGAIVDFGPLADIGNFVFKKRRLDSITFDNLNNTFRVENGKVIIPPMRIASSAVNIDLQGVYGLGGGTNIQMQIPLRNPNRDTAVTDEAERYRRSRKGIILNLHAVDGPDGKVKIKMGKGNED